MDKYLLISTFGNRVFAETVERSLETAHCAPILEEVIIEEEDAIPATYFRLFVPLEHRAYAEELCRTMLLGPPLMGEYNHTKYQEAKDSIERLGLVADS